MIKDSTSKQVLVIGAGPAGLSAAYRLTQRGVPTTVLEASPTSVGGIARTVEHNGFRFDIGGHRFFTKSAEVEKFWQEILGDDFLHCERRSRVFHRGKFYEYPIRGREVLCKFGLFRGAFALCSYLKAQLFRRAPVRSFEDWMVNNFGSYLYKCFFKTYTEKVWGMKCTDISADWAAQRIKGLSLVRLIKSVLFPSTEPTIKTLTESFKYPRLGPGQLWEMVRKQVQSGGGEVLLGHSVTKIKYESGYYRVSCDRIFREGASCKLAEEFTCSELISSMPMSKLIPVLEPRPPEGVCLAASGLRYRDFLIIVLIVDHPDLFPDNWLYIQDDGFTVGRIQNFKNWSSALVPDAKLTSIGMEYFCNQGDELWQRSDSELIHFASSELKKLKLDSGGSILDGVVIREPKAYPVYDGNYSEHVELIRGYLEREHPGIQLIGRNGMHRYNNQDHAVMTGFLAAENIISGKWNFSPWRVNQDAEYLEEEVGVTEKGRFVPSTI